jgi:hypothetical protein
MIKKIVIENFKGFRERVELDIGPITLLFGANSAGKSSVLHALHLAREMFNSHKYDVDRPGLGAGSVDLGGFKSFVHQHDLSKEITLAITCSVGYGMSDGKHDAELYLGDAAVITEPSNVRLTVHVQWSEVLKAPFCNRFEIDWDSEPLVIISGTPGRVNQEMFINRNHKSLVTNSETAVYREVDVSGANSMDEDEKVLSVLLQECMPFSKQESNWIGIDVSLGNDALPQDSWLLDIYEMNIDDETRKFVFGLISTLIYGPFELVRQNFQQLRFLGPLRETPQRNFAPHIQSAPERWASGLAAWDLIYTLDAKAFGEVSDWLGDPDKMNTGYRLQRDEIVEIPLSHTLLKRFIDGRAFTDDDAPRLQLDQFAVTTQIALTPASDVEGGDNSCLRLKPHDVGVGISQLIPVLVAALDGSATMTIVEQPELHLHPKAQVALGDLFIHAINRKDNESSYLIETHSEHLLLRLLRRIRETNEGSLPQGLSPLTPDELAINFVESRAGLSKITKIPVDRDGEFTVPWPHGFFEERAEELFGP